jgi:hypothetical protein
MGAKENPRERSDERGQSLLEFLFLLPVLLGMVFILFRVSATIQMSIVNQKYIRSHMLNSNFNSAVYPRRERVVSDFAPYNYNRMVMGMGEEPVDEENEGRVDASVSMITRSKRLAGSRGPDQDEPVERSYVRIRNTIAMCTQFNVVSNGGAPEPFSGNNLFDGSRIEICRGNPEEN